MIRFIILNLILSSLCFAAKDTLIVSDGNQTRFILNERRIDSSSIKIIVDQYTEIVNWNFDKSTNSIIFNTPPDSGLPFHITFNKDYINFPKKTFLYEKKIISSEDSVFDSKNISYVDLRNSDKLSISGFKSFSISADNSGSINLEQGLDIRVGGDIKPGTELSAHLSDQGSSLEGSTREISDFDLIYIQLKNQKYNVTVGDQYVNWIDNGYLYQQKKIKGISASLLKNNFNVLTFGSLAGGSYAVQNIESKEGVQGPYYLKGKGENGYISPIGGTVYCTINGENLKEGQDFTVDYDLGFITFSNKKLIREKDIIRVEYEYKLFDYQQVLAGVNTNFYLPDSSLKVRGSFWTNADNKNNPIDITLNSADKSSLKNSGDSLPYRVTESEIDPKDVPSKSSIYPLYKKFKDKNGNSFYKYTQYDPKNPEDRKDYFQIWFSDFGENNGDYSIDSVVNNTIVFVIYRYVGKGLGRYLPVQRLSAPQRNISGELIGEFNKEIFGLKTQFAGESIDKNTFSYRNDDDNNSSALKSNFRVGNKDTKLWLSGDYLYSSRNFSREILSKYEKLKSWDDTSTSTISTAKHFYDVSLGIAPFSLISTEISYGENRNETGLQTQKIYNTTDISIGKLHLNYKGSLFKHDHLENNKSRKQSINTVLDYTNHKVDMLLEEEWHTNITKDNTGLLEGKLSYSYLPLNFNESFTYTSFRKGKSLFNASDTGYGLLWEQSIKCKPTSIWEFTGNSAYNRSVKDNDKEVTLLVNIENSLSLKQLSFLQKYSTSYEQASAFIQVPVYAGKGLGTYMYDSILKEYIPHVPGDWYMEQKEVYDQFSDQRIKKSSFLLNWSFQPDSSINGLLGDLTWDGYLSIDEHINAGAKRISSWLPGYRTLYNYTGNKTDDKVKYADLSYRQDILWNPEKYKNFTASFYIIPTLRKQNTYTESGLETGLGLDQKGEKLSIANKTKYLTVNHDDNSNTDQKFKDVNSEFVEKYLIFKSTNIITKECIGLANQRNDIKEKVSLFNTDSTFYYQLSTGLQWNWLKLGSAEILYTFSSVPERENMDYRMAKGYQTGNSHIATLSVNMHTAQHLQINCYYRGEINKKKSNADNTFNQILSVEAKILF